MTRIFLIIFLILNTSFMSKNNTFVICKADNQDLVIMCVDSKGCAQFTTEEVMCMKFNTEAQAQAMISTLNEPIGFVGTRPIRR